MSGMRSAAARLLWRNPAGRRLPFSAVAWIFSAAHPRRGARPARRSPTAPRLPLRWHGRATRDPWPRVPATARTACGKEVILVPLVPNDVVGRLPQPGDAHPLQPIPAPAVPASLNRGSLEGDMPRRIGGCRLSRFPLSVRHAIRARSHRARNRRLGGGARPHALSRRRPRRRRPRSTATSSTPRPTAARRPATCTSRMSSSAAGRATSARSTGRSAMRDGASLQNASAKVCTYGGSCKSVAPWQAPAGHHGERQAPAPGQGAVRRAVARHHQGRRDRHVAGDAGVERSWIPDTWRTAVACGVAIGVLAALIWGGLDVATGGPAFLGSLPGHLAVTLASSTVVCLLGYRPGAAGSKPAP